MDKLGLEKGKVFFFAAITKGLSPLVGKSKNQIKEKIRKRKIHKRNVILFKCWTTNGFDIEIRMIANQDRYFRLDKIHYFRLKNACRHFLEKNQQKSLNKT